MGQRDILIPSTNLLGEPVTIRLRERDTHTFFSSGVRYYEYIGTYEGTPAEVEEEIEAQSYADTEARMAVHWARIGFEVSLFTSLIPGADAAEDGLQVVTGKDLNGTPVSRWDSARGMALSFVPGFKKLRKVSKTLAAAEDARKAGKKIDKTAKALTVGNQLNKAKEDLGKCVKDEGQKAVPNQVDPAVPGPNPNGLRQRVVESPTAGEGGVYLKPHQGKTKIGSTDDFKQRYGENADDGIEVEIPQTRTSPPPGVDDSKYPWSGGRQRRFDEEYLDRLTPPDVRYRAPEKPQSPVSQLKWDLYRSIFGYGDVPSDYGY